MNPAEVIRSVAEETGADVRTVLRWFAGLPTRNVTARAIERAATARGLVRAGSPMAITSTPRPMT